MECPFHPQFNTEISKLLRPMPVKSNKCACPLWSAFALGCVFITVSFATITTLSGVMFSNTIDGSVTTNIDLALRGALDQVMQPLEESERYIERLRDKIESEPDTYALNDADSYSLAGNPSLIAFCLDAMLASLQRPEMLYIFQVRQSTRYEHSPGFPVDSILVASGPDRQFLLLTNNTWLQVDIPVSSNLTNISGIPTLTAEVNMSGAPFIDDAYNTPDKRWVVAAFSVPDAGVATSTLLTVYAKIRGFAGGHWAVGIDHNMANFRELMLQATPPFSVGTVNPDKIVVGDSHTSLYDLHGGSFVTSSLQGVELFKSETELWPAGGTPSSSLNSAYTTAINVCTSKDCTHPVIHRDGKRLISILRVRHAETDLDLLLVSSVPRDYFFGEADTSLYVSISVAAVCCVLMIVGCVALLMCIRPALQQLQVNMLLASELQNDRVEHTDSVLTDIAELSSTFDEMNQRLLVARSFVPEAVLLGQKKCDDEDDDEGSLISGRKSSWARMNPSISSSQQSSVVGSRKREISDMPSTLSSEKMAKLFELNEKRVSVLSLNMVGFNDLVASDRQMPRPQKIQEVSAHLLAIVVRCAQRERGVMDSFHGDHFVLTYNASRAVAGSLAAAVRTAATISEEVQRDALFHGSVGVAAGTASGKAYVGTLGIDGHRRLSLVGPAYRHAIGLQGVCAQFIRRMATQKGAIAFVGCVVEEAALKEVSSCNIYMQLIGQATDVSSQLNRIPVYAAHSHVIVENDDDEWLYELDAMQAGDPFQEPNKAMGALLNGNMAEYNDLATANNQRSAGRRNSEFARIGSDFSAKARLSGTSSEHTLGAPHNPTHQISPWSTLEVYVKMNSPSSHSGAAPWDYYLM